MLVIAKKKTLMSKLLTHSLNYLSRRSYSEQELRLKLRKDFSSLSDFETQIESTLQRLRELHLLNDRRIAECYALRLNHKGNQWIKHSLRQKGITEHIIIEVLSLLDSESERALFEAKKKLTHLPGEESYQLEKRLFRFLSGRGFSSQSIKDAIIALRRTKFVCN